MRSNDACVFPDTAIASAPAVIFTSNVADVPGSQYIRIHPNPSNGSFTLHFLNGLNLRNEDVQMRICNAYGQVVHEETFPDKALSRAKTITLNGTIPNGVYYLSLSTGKRKVLC
jgi:hypothetical protein